MIVHPGSNVGAVVGFGAVLVGGLDWSNFPEPGSAVDALSNTVPISPTQVELLGP